MLPAYVSPSSSASPVAFPSRFRQRTPPTKWRSFALRLRRHSPSATRRAACSRTLPRHSVSRACRSLTWPRITGLRHLQRGFSFVTRWRAVSSSCRGQAPIASARPPAHLSSMPPTTAGRNRACSVRASPAQSCCPFPSAMRRQCQSTPPGFAGRPAIFRGASTPSPHRAAERSPSPRACICPARSSSSRA